MNSEICKHYADKVESFNRMGTSICKLERRIKMLNDPSAALEVGGESITYYMGKDSASELKVLVMSRIQDEIIKIKTEMEAL